ncbi:hypothetical protein A4X09_0g6596 [Tilletia walkeri]|uniref:Uncharacterized protein n=1 Tax=Tilletia walkeri TaxID=117179 RepID=A0A8X7N2H6_9BASI|nr:hypothetical protein A4X09_0g6596 [Tilletia walkeri]
MAARKADDLHEQAQTLLEGNAGWKRNAETLNEQLGEDRNALSSDAEAAELLNVLAGISLGLSRTVSAPSTSRLPLSSPMSSMSGYAGPWCTKHEELESIQDDAAFASGGASKVNLTIEGVRINAKDIAFGFCKKTG